MRAIVATGSSILTVVWHLLADPTARYDDLGASFHDSRYYQRHQHNLFTNSNASPDNGSP